MIGCLRTRVRKQPIIALYFEPENELKLYNLETRSSCKCWVPTKRATCVILKVFGMKSSVDPDDYVGVLFLRGSSTYFTEGRLDLPREAIGRNGSNCFSMSVRTRISKETYSHLWFSRRGGLDLLSLLWIRPCKLALIVLYHFHRTYILLKVKTKKLSLKIILKIIIKNWVNVSVKITSRKS